MFVFKFWRCLNKASKLHDAVCLSNDSSQSLTMQAQGTYRPSLFQWQLSHLRLGRVRTAAAANWRHAGASRGCGAAAGSATSNDVGGEPQSCVSRAATERILCCRHVWGSPFLFSPCFIQLLVDRFHLQIDSIAVLSCD